MEGMCGLKSSLALALAIVLILASVLLIDSYRANLFQSFFSLQSHTKSSYGLPWRGSSSGSVHAGTDNHESQSGAASHNRSDEKGMRSFPKVEISLRRARAAIRKAILHSEQKPEPGNSSVPSSDIYRNALAFHQSYKEMEKRFKIYVYREGEPPLVHDGPCIDIYTTEGRFIHEIGMEGRFVTVNPEDAHVYFLPFSVTFMVSYIYKSNYDVTPLTRFVRDYIDVVAHKYPFWNRSLGADHFMLSCHDWGPLASMGNPLLYNNSIRVLCNANTSEGFNPTKDATLPEIKYGQGTVPRLLDAPSALERPLLAFFAGGNHGPVRPILFKHWKNGTDDDMQVHEYLPNGLSYLDFLKKSRYCLCPSGYEVASPRIVEAIYTECVPVIISKDYALPFSDVLNWTSFSVQVPVSEIPNLKTILQSIPVKRYVEMQSKLKQVQKHFTINQPPKPHDFFHMILHSIWLRRINIQISS
eukprot:PITA_05818